MRFRGRIGSVQGAGRYYRRRFRRGMRSGDAPPRLEVCQFGLHSIITVPDGDTVGGGGNDLAEGNTFSLAVALMTALNYEIGGSSDLAAIVNDMSINGIVWSSTFFTEAPVTGVREYLPITEMLYLNRNDSAGAPASLPVPWAPTPPFGGTFADEQENIPVRILSKRDLILPVGEFNADAEGTSRTLSTKSVRIKRKFGDFTGLYLQASIGNARIYSPAPQPQVEWILRGHFYYRTRF